MTTTNYQLIVTEDISLNGRLFVSGNVGIGKTNPTVALDVVGDINVSGLTKAAGGVITKYYEVNATTTCDAKYYGSFVSIVSATSGFTLTLPPAQTGYIQIFNNTQVSHTIAASGGSTFYGLSYSGTSSISINPKDILTLFCGGNWVITDHTNFNSGLYENSSGYVGIGTTNPGSKLDVVGTVNATMFRSSSGTIATINGTYANFFTLQANSTYIISVMNESSDGTSAMFTIISDSNDYFTNRICGNNLSCNISGSNLQIRSDNNVAYNNFKWVAIKLM
jgi:hypothetical protein